MVIDTLEIDASILGRKLSTEEIRKLQLEMLDEFAAFCDANGLTYYLSAGTLLGAVRHKGYIPWDDDIDVNMPRPDFDRLIQLTKGKLGDHLEIASPEGPIEHTTSFPRVCDIRYILNSFSTLSKRSYYTNLFIDIFPIEGLPTAWNRVKLHYLLSRSMIVMRRLAYYTGIGNESRSALRLTKLVMQPIAKLMGYRFWNRMLLRIAKHYRYEDCPYVGVVTGYEHTFQEYIEKEGYGAPVKVTFEGKLYNAPANTDKYLKNLYGDYMKLPPEEKRVAHHFDVWEIKGGTA